MKRFKQFIREASKPKSPAPRGVLFLNNGRTAIVGVEHGQNPPIADELKQRIQSVANVHGKYWEGNGGDIAPLEKTWGKKETYRGGFDDEYAESIRDEKGNKVVRPHHLSVMFGNSPESTEEVVQKIKNPTTSIFQTILGKQEHCSFFKDRRFDHKVLSSFLRQASEPKQGIDLHGMAQVPATEQNLRHFFKTGFNLSWPTGKGSDGREAWLSYPNNAGKLSKAATDERNNFVMNKPGVHFIGAGHLDQIKQLADEQGKKDLESHGGELSAK